MTQVEAERIGVIGAGNMAEALVRGWLAKGICRPVDITASDPAQNRRDHLRHELGIQTTPDNATALHGSTVMLLAVKPQVLPAVLTELRPILPPGLLVISIAAGISTRRMESLLGAHPRVIRAMPNTPALVGAGVTALCVGHYAGPEDGTRASRLLGAVGRVVPVREEEMDAVTALSGSGPAYVFYVIEAWLRAAHRLGLDPETARTLAVETVLGAARLLTDSEANPEELRRRVTSKGGTTEAALRVLEERNVAGAFEAALTAAAGRSRELSGGFPALRRAEGP